VRESLPRGQQASNDRKQAQKCASRAIIALRRVRRRSFSSYFDFDQQQQPAGTVAAAAARGAACRKVNKRT